MVVMFAKIYKKSRVVTENRTQKTLSARRAGIPYSHTNFCPDTYLDMKLLYKTMSLRN